MVSPHLSVVLGFLFISRILASGEKLNIWTYAKGGDAVGGDADAAVYNAVNSWRDSRNLPPVVRMGDRFIADLTSLDTNVDVKINDFKILVPSFTAFMNKIKDATKGVNLVDLPPKCPESTSVEGEPILLNAPAPQAAGFPFTNFRSVSASLVKRNNEAGGDFIKALSENKSAAAGDITDDPRFNFLLPSYGLNMICSKDPVKCERKLLTVSETDGKKSAVIGEAAKSPDNSEGTYDFCLFFTSYALMKEGDKEKHLQSSVTALMKGETPLPPPWASSSGAFSFQPGSGLVVMYLLVFLSVYVLV